MDTKQMRKELKVAGITCPVSNKDVIAKYNEIAESINQKTNNLKSDTDAQKMEAYKKEMASPATVGAPKSPVKLVSSNVYTYVGTGPEPPHMINFMGKQKFIRGQAVEVTNPDVLAKIKNSPCFVKGKVDQEKMFESDETAKKEVEEKRAKDMAIEESMLRKNRA